jgi:hypothetical protein
MPREDFRLVIRVNQGVLHPIVRSAVVVVESHLIFMIHRRIWIELRTIFNLLFGQIDTDSSIRPTDGTDPFWGNEYGLFKPEFGRTAFNGASIRILSCL